MNNEKIDQDIKVCSAKLENIEKQVSHIRALLMGNGVIGIAEMARRSFDYMLLCKKTKNGILDWTFRIIITILLSYVAIEIGLK